ncbi:17875_t:CDS:2 [Rhizophagus irregularis]|nr:17875_t:CDS:2 [Rhizophagus irregularis]
MGYYPPDSNEEWLALQCPVPVKECPKKDCVLRAIMAAFGAVGSLNVQTTTSNRSETM